VTRPLVLATGFVALDRIYPAGGAQPVEMAGGPCGNLAANLAVLGVPVALLARLGQDEEAARVIDELAAFGVDTRWVRHDPAIRTPMVIQRNAEPGADEPDHRFFYRRPETGAWVPRHAGITADQAAAMRRSGIAPALLYFDRISAPVLDLARDLRERGALIYAEPTVIEDRRLTAAALDLAHVVKSSVAQVAERFVPAGVPLRVRTMGADGLRYSLAGGDWRYLAAAACPRLVDTAGAGDALSAGLIAEMVRAGTAALTTPVIEAGLAAGQRLAVRACAHLGAGGWRRARHQSAAGPG
jgi:fructokinase